MNLKILAIVSLLFASILLSGCSFADFLEKGEAAFADIEVPNLEHSGYECNIVLVPNVEGCEDIDRKHVSHMCQIRGDYKPEQGVPSYCKTFCLDRSGFKEYPSKCYKISVRKSSFS